MVSQVKTYFWAAGAQRKITADTVGDRIDTIASRNNGLCHPQDLVDDARPPTSPIHPLFEWDDEVAAELFRRDQARQVIRLIRPMIADDGTRAPFPAYVHVNIAGQDGYMRTDQARSQDEVWAEVLDDALKQLTGLEKRYKHLSELADVWQAVSEVKRKTRKKVTN